MVWSGWNLNGRIWRVTVNNARIHNALTAFRPHPDLSFSAHSSGTSRVPPASPSSHSLAPPSGERSRLARGSTIRSTFHGGQVRDRRAGGGSGGGVQNGPPASPTLAHEATPLPSGRPRPTTNLFTKLTSKLTRR